MAGQKRPPSSDLQSTFFYGYVVVAASLWIMLAVWGAYFAFGVFFKPMLAEFGWSRAVLSGAFSVSMLTQSVLGVVMGGLTDRLGSRIVMIFCGILLGLGYFLMSRVTVPWQLYLVYGVVIGTGMTGSFIPVTSTIARWFKKKRGLMTGVVLSGSGLGGLIAPPAATRLISSYGWRLSFLIMAVVILVAVTLAASFLRRDPAQMGQLPYGESKDNPTRAVGTWGLSLREALRQNQFYTAFAMFFCFGFSMFAITVHLVPHASEAGISAIRAAGILAVVGGAMIAGRLLLGGAADRLGNRPIFLIGFILVSADLLLLVSAKEIWMFYLGAAVFGFANGGMGTSESPLVAELFGLRSHGLILSVAGGGFTLGAAAGPFVAGYLFDLSGNYRTAFLICVALSILGLILTLLLKPIRSRHKPTG